MLDNSKNNLSDPKDLEIVKEKNFELKNLFKNKDEKLKYLKEIEGIEVVDFLDSGSESNVYHISVVSKNS